MLQAINISKSYGDLKVLSDVSLDVAKGEIVAIVGKSGSGKTTLLHIIGTLDNPNHGEIILNNQLISHLKHKELARFRNESLGFIFQFHHLLAEFSAVENVMIPALIGKRKEDKSKKRATELLTYLGLAERLEHKPNQMSGGEQQRVAIARALINNPDIILADEPTGNLDDKISEEFFDLILQLRKDFGQTFIIVTHNKELASRCDRTLTLSQGRLV
ncbi:MAG: ABC transporter ATP-binding protein [Saprospiraceae bacterium]